MKSKIAMGDPFIGKQLTKGFYNVEGSSWRWTARQFAVVFPGFTGNSVHKSYNLRLSVFVPESQIAKLGYLTLYADVNGTPLTGETFREAGAHVYARSVPGTALESNIVPVVFSLDKSTNPLSSDGRELGLVVNEVQLTAN